jgi:hypothetical protein
MPFGSGNHQQIHSMGETMNRVWGMLLACGGVFVLTGAIWLEEWKSGIPWLEPVVIDPGDAQTPPSDAIVLFDGTDLAAWKGGEGWSIEQGVATAGGKGGITTQQNFGDCQLHLEWASPAEVKGKGQGRGNSGVYLMNKYEVQILDSYENETYFDGQCAAIYKQYPPLVNASRKPGEWQTYDILFTAPRFYEDGSLKSPAYLTVLHNGVVVQNHVELLGGTFWSEPPSYKKHPEKGPIHLQNHGDPVQFRNIWIRELPQSPARADEPPAE